MRGLLIRVLLYMLHIYWKCSYLQWIHKSYNCKYYKYSALIINHSWSSLQELNSHPKQAAGIHQTVRTLNKGTQGKCFLYGGYVLYLSQSLPTAVRKNNVQENWCGQYLCTKEIKITVLWYVMLCSLETGILTFQNLGMYQIYTATNSLPREPHISPVQGPFWNHVTLCASLTPTLWEAQTKDRGKKYTKQEIRIVTFCILNFMSTCIHLYD